MPHKAVILWVRITEHLKSQTLACIHMHAMKFVVVDGSYLAILEHKPDRTLMFRQVCDRYEGEALLYQVRLHKCFNHWI